MPKILRIAVTEYLNAIRSKAFILGIVMLPVFMFGGIVVSRFARDKTDIKDRRVAVLDHTRSLTPIIAAKAKERNEREIFDWSTGIKGRQNRPAFIVEDFRPKAGEEDRSEVILSERVRRNELLAFLVIGKNSLSMDGGPGAEISYYTETPTFAELPDWLEHIINDEVRRVRFEKANVDQTLVRKLSRGASFKKLGLVKIAATGEIIGAKEENKMATFGLPAGAMFLLFMLVMSSAPALLNTVLEEKIQKISEVLISAVTPFQLMLGKLIGAVLVSLTLSALYLTAIGFFLWKTGLADLVPPTLYLWFLLFQLLALLIFGSIFSGIGASCSEIRDAQSMMFPAMLLIMIPLFTWMPVLQSPSSTFARVVSLFPPATPMLMLLRIAIPPGPPWWEIVLGVVLTVGFMLACVWASAKIFRIGLLSQGQAPSLARLVSWLMSR